MYNLHCHSLLSDGVLLPSEIAVRYQALGYKAIAITDHVDYSNIELTVKAILEFTQHWPRNSILKILPGIELTHLPLEQFKPLAKYARKEGIKVIVAHGETLVEPVIKGTNRAALEADIDILAHPGLISEEEARFAKQKNIFLEITSRKGHCDTNGHVVEAGLKCGAKLIINNDSHAPEDITAPEDLIKTGLKSGLSQKEIDKIYQDVGEFLKGKGVS
jgi:histidinol phosphatase-like PHP family hydrolase